MNEVYFINGGKVWKTRIFRPDQRTETMYDTRELAEAALIELRAAVPYTGPTWAEISSDIEKPSKKTKGKTAYEDSV